MSDIFQKYLSEKINLTDQDYKLIESVGEIKKLQKRQYLLQEGDIWRYNAFVCEGCLRTYRVDDKGMEHILYFSIENWWTGDRESLLSGNPSKLNIDAMEDSTVLLFTIGNFEMLKSKISAFKVFVNSLQDRSFISTNSQPNSTTYDSFLFRYICRNIE